MRCTTPGAASWSTSSAAGEAGGRLRAGLPWARRAGPGAGPAAGEAGGVRSVLVAECAQEVGLGYYCNTRCPESIPQIGACELGWPVCHQSPFAACHPNPLAPVQACGRTGACVLPFGGQRQVSGRRDLPGCIGGTHRRRQPRAPQQQHAAGDGAWRAAHVRRRRSALTAGNTRSPPVHAPRRAARWHLFGNILWSVAGWFTLAWLARVALKVHRR